MESKYIKRVFKFNNEELDDPNPKFTPEEVKRHYSGIYPSLTTAQIEGPKIKGGLYVYTFKTSIGTNG